MIILTWMPALCATLTASMASSRGGSRMAIMATIDRYALRARMLSALMAVTSSSAPSSTLRQTQHNGPMFTLRFEMLLHIFTMASLLVHF